MNSFPGPYRRHRLVFQDFFKFFVFYSSICGPLQSQTREFSLDNPRSSHCPAIRPGPALGCNFCWNTIDDHGRILRRKTKYHCPECQTNLCIVPCFQEYHERQANEAAGTTTTSTSTGATTIAGASAAVTTTTATASHRPSSPGGRSAGSAETTSKGKPKLSSFSGTSSSSTTSSPSVDSGGSQPVHPQHNPLESSLRDLTRGSLN